MNRTLIFISLFAIISYSLVSCIGNEEEPPIPKPRAYYRLNFPEKKYKLYDTTCPFIFEIPVYSQVENDPSANAEPCWINVSYPLYKAKLHLSYKEVHNNLSEYLENSREFAMRHQIKATGMDQQLIMHDSAKVYGLLYDISGNTASAVQFYVTDSTRHFLRGSLYFNCPPNIDSLKIIVDYLRQDILHMVQTLRWKDAMLKK